MDKISLLNLHGCVWTNLTSKSCKVLIYKCKYLDRSSSQFGLLSLQFCPQILYTQPNPNIKYEFLTDSEPEESNDIPMSQPSHHSSPRHHRHHNAETHKKDLEHSKSETSLSKHPDFNTLESQSQIESNVIGDRKFVWKILTFTQCSRTCGGGLQIGKFKCVEVTGKEDREVSSAYCTGAPPPTRRRRCGGAPCPPRWRAAAWGPCPVCGPAQRTRIVGCVQDHARGITKV